MGNWDSDMYNIMEPPCVVKTLLWYGCRIFQHQGWKPHPSILLYIGGIESRHQFLLVEKKVLCRIKIGGIESDKTNRQCMRHGDGHH
jgi:hypothetical protein